MPHYQRLMRRRGAHVYTDGEQDTLLQLLVSAPGAKHAEVIGRHPKGGYRTRLELSPDAVDDFTAYLDHHDWISVF